MEEKLSDDILSRDGQAVGSWNGEDVNELMANLSEIRKRHKLSPEGIPHKDQIPDDLRDFRAYLLWACDKKENCLVGSGANRTETVASIRKFYGNQIAKDALARHQD